VRLLADGRDTHFVFSFLLRARHELGGVPSEKVVVDVVAKLWVAFGEWKDNSAWALTSARRSLLLDFDRGVRMLSV